jgi:hypothetical protein
MTEIVPAAPAATPAAFQLYNPDLDFSKLGLETKYFTSGFQLVSKQDLIGVPHVIIGVTYRPGFTDKTTKEQYSYVSIEAVIADKNTLDSSPVKHYLPDPLNVYPNQSVVYNDGGTGVRRELTRLFHQIGVINVGDITADSDFDKPMSKWARGQEHAEDGITSDADGEKFRFMAVRGLRVSEYEYEGQPASTYYFG